MKDICFYFQVHQPFRLRDYRFFDIGNHQAYFNEEANAAILRKVADKCYIPANRLLLQLINRYEGRFRVAFSISGTVLDQMEKYAPDTLESFRELVQTGCVELLAETYGHSLAALMSASEFKRQVHAHSQKMREVFGVQPQVFRNTELIYSDAIGQMAAEMGFKAIITEGADKILGWRSPNFLYSAENVHPQLLMLLKNYRLSDDIAFRFSNSGWEQWPLNVEKFTGWLNHLPEEEEIVNLFMDYETFGEHQWESSGIFEFLQKLPESLLAGNHTFVTPSQAIARLQPVGVMHVPEPVSWADEARDLSAWLGNELQDDAFHSLYRLEEKVSMCSSDQQIMQEWTYLQTSDHFYYMCTKYFADGDVHKYFNHYDSPYQAFINYMNVLSDFEMKLNERLEAGKAAQKPVREKSTTYPRLLKEKVRGPKIRSVQKSVY